MILNFSIKNFGTIKNEQTISFEANSSKRLENYYLLDTESKYRILKIGLIYGANASGKTTIIEALQFLRDIVLDPSDKKTVSFGLTPYFFDDISKNDPTRLTLEFLQSGNRYRYSVLLNDEAVLEEELIKYNRRSEVFTRVSDLKNQFTKVKFGNVAKKGISKNAIENLESNTLWNNTVLGGYLKTNIEIPILGEVVDWFGSYLSPIIRPGMNLNEYVASRITSGNIDKEDVLRFLKKADLNISDINIKKEEHKIDSKILQVMDLLDFPEKERERVSHVVKLDFEHLVNEKSYSLPVEMESLGTQKYFGFAGILSMLVRESNAIMIDELESSLHPDLFMHFILTFLVNSKSSQLITTTHHREFFNSKDVIRDDSIWFTNNIPGEGTELYSLADFDSSVIRNTSNVYNAYKLGKLGAVPNLGDLYID